MSKLPSLQTYFILKQVIYLTIKYSIILHSALVIHAESSKRPSKHLLELILSFNLEKKKKHRGDFKANTKQGAGIIILPQYLEKPFSTGTMPTAEA